jgi:hypothetical protein
MVPNMARLIINAGHRSKIRQAIQGPILHLIKVVVVDKLLEGLNTVDLAEFLMKEILRTRATQEM